MIIPCYNQIINTRRWYDSQNDALELVDRKDKNSHTVEELENEIELKIDVVCDIHYDPKNVRR
jgi:hypothetical protein